MNDKYRQIVIYQMLNIKLTEIRKDFCNISFADLYEYFNEVILKNNKIIDLNDISFFIMNIKINKIFEYLNIKAILDKDISVKDDLESILER